MVALGAIGTSISIKPAKAIVKKMVLVEQFTATWCGPCVRGTEMMDGIYDKYGERDFILIRHHPSTQGDAMVNKFAQLRANKLGMSYYPSFFIDTKLTDSRTTDALTKDIKEAKSKGATSSISVDKSTMDNLTVNLQIEYENVPEGGEIWYCLVEDFLYVKAQNGEKRHRFISRDGGSIPSISGDGSTSVSIEINPKWSTEMLRVYAWIETRVGVDNSDYYDFGHGDINHLGPVIASYPNELDFGKMKPNSSAEAEINIRNCGLQDASVNLKIAENYLSLEKSVNLPQLSETSYTIRVSTRNLEPGVYRGILQLQGDSYEKNIPFQLQVLHSPEIKIDTNTINFGEIKRGQNASETIKVSNVYEGALTGTTSTKEEWLRSSPRAFSENAFDVKVSISTSKLKAGDYAGTVYIESDGGNKEISVTLTIVAAEIVIDKEEIKFGSLTLKEAKNVKETLTISNEGDADATIEITQIPSFIDMDDKRFTLESGEEKVFTILLKHKELSVSQYQENIVFELSQETIEIPVSVEIIEEPAILRLESDYLSEDGIFTVETEDQNVEIECVIYNDGEARMDGTIEHDASWLRLSDHSFALLGGRKKTITLSFNVEKAKKGKNTGKIMFTSNGGNQEIDIHFVVSKESVVIQFQIGNKTVLINNKPKTMDAAPFILNGRTVVPIRVIAEAFGAEIQWEGSTQTITILLDKKTIVMKVGSTIASIDDNPIILDAPPVIQNGRTFVPLRFIAEAFGAEIQWEGSTQTITITL
jgi:thiol-disulfide isomerase/thioredoxin